MTWCQSFVQKVINASEHYEAPAPPAAQAGCQWLILYSGYSNLQLRSWLDPTIMPILHTRYAQRQELAVCGIQVEEWLILFLPRARRPIFANISPS